LSLFDAWLFVDWSASSRPKTGADSIWAVDGWSAGGRPLNLVSANLPTRCEAGRWLMERIRSHLEAGRRVLAGFDFPLAYPQGSLQRLFPSEDASWRTLWRHLAAAVKDGESNDNNRFELAGALNQALGERWYWGCPPKAASGDLACNRLGRRGAPEYRLVERKLLAEGRRPFSVWQLLGSGSVGSQTLLGLPLCERLRAQLGSVAVWPFETGLRAPARGGGPSVVLCEIWPGVIDVARAKGEVRDQAQVLSYLRAAASRDAAGTLGEWFEVRGLAAAERALIESEGWILGFIPSPGARAQRRSRSPRTARTSGAASAARRPRPSAATAR
jgi:precorrin-8X/cobalt-precorrin-8 methylmutase